MKDLARRLLAASRSSADSHFHEAVVLIETLRMTLTKFAGAAGFAALLQRSLLLASEDVPLLKGVKCGADGRLEGFEKFVADAGETAASEVAVAITVQLLGLLVTFIGESLTMKLVREALPDTAMDEQQSRNRVS